MNNITPTVVRYLTRQPPLGKPRQGGLHVGEVEQDVAYDIVIAPSERLIIKN
jgi:DNA-directed RNA polymerase beta subunit